MAVTKSPAVISSHFTGSDAWATATPAAIHPETTNRSIIKLFVSNPIQIKHHGPGVGRLPCRPREAADHARQIAPREIDLVEPPAVGETNRPEAGLETVFVRHALRADAPRLEFHHLTAVLPRRPKNNFRCTFDGAARLHTPVSGGRLPVEADPFRRRRLPTDTNAFAVVIVRPAVLCVLLVDSYEHGPLRAFAHPAGGRKIRRKIERSTKSLRLYRDRHDAKRHTCNRKFGHLRAIISGFPAAPRYNRYPFGR